MINVPRATEAMYKFGSDNSSNYEETPRDSLVVDMQDPPRVLSGAADWLHCQLRISIEGGPLRTGN